MASFSRLTSRLLSLTMAQISAGDRDRSAAWRARCRARRNRADSAVSSSMVSRSNVPGAGWAGSGCKEMPGTVGLAR
jgi:hypothetical protein